MRRLCTTVAIVSSLLVAAAPVQAHTSAGHRQKAHTGAVHTHATTSPVHHAQKFTWGRT